MQTSNNINWIPANWTAPSWVHAGITTRTGGFSSSPFDSFNLALHVGDFDKNVISNRELLYNQLNIKTEPCWLDQKHSNKVINVNDYGRPVAADGSYTNMPDNICVVMTADCLPLLLSDLQGTTVSAIHIGWRGFSQNIIKEAVNNFTVPKDELIAWLGPCISAYHYEIDDKVYDASINIFDGAEDCFNSTRPGHWQMDLHRLVHKQLSCLGLHKIYGNKNCTYSEESFFYSHRRDGITGRMASMIWIDSRVSLD